METDDHFEDFTTASEWELFIAKLEQLLNEWMGKPVDPENVTNGWLVFHERVTFADFPFKFSYCKRIKGTKEGKGSKLIAEDTIESSNKVINDCKNSSALLESNNVPPYLVRTASSECNFPPAKNCPFPISDYFDVEEYSVLTSAGLEPVQKEPRLKILLSSACIAVNNTNCNFPIFVQFHHWRENYFYGVGEFSGIRTSFQIVKLNTCQNGNLPTHLNGLLDIFKSKIGTGLAVPVGVCVHFFHKLRSWPSEYSYDSFPPDMLEIIRGNPDPEKIKTDTVNEKLAILTEFLPFGSVVDPFLNIEFVAGWPSLTEDVVVDSLSYTDLEPDNAELFYFKLNTDLKSEFRLHDLIEGVWNLRKDVRTFEQVLGKSIENSQDTVEYSSALEKITKSTVPAIPLAGLNKVLGVARRSKRQTLFNPDAYEELAPLRTDQIELLLKYLFPDSSNEKKYKYPEPGTYEQSVEFQKPLLQGLVENLQGIKSAPIGSLVWRIAVVAAYLNTYEGLKGAVAYLWAELVLELRFRMENSILICGLEKGSPNSGTCLLNQKLQMLNCCIEKKLDREARENQKLGTDGGVESGCEESDEDDDEFFDCEENVSSSDNIRVAKLNKPTGRLRKNGRLRLINTGEPMYIPINQNPAPLTEDEMEEQSRILIELGDDAHGSELRAKIMSASLLSDMESFKAANPGALLEDFVRWYSPRDWTEGDEIDEFGNKSGELSHRMKVPGNLWQEVWSAAQAVPARRQKRLFDDTKEAEKVLRWLNMRSIADISELLFPCLIHAATLKLMEEVDKLPVGYEIQNNLPQLVVQLTRSFSFISKSNHDIHDTSNQKSLVMSAFAQIEKEVTQLRSFRHKFPGIDLQEILDISVENTDRKSFLSDFVQITDANKGDVVKTIKDMFYQEWIVSVSKQTNDADTEFKFEKPYKKVFLLKYNPVQAVQSYSSSSLPQRMSCCITHDQFTLAGTFSSKTDLS